jgi:DNA-binding IclR family transcriptional regulator
VIAQRTGLPSATASRLVAEFVEHGLLCAAITAESASVHLCELAQRASPTLALREVAMPFMQELHSSSSMMRIPCT